MPHRKVMKVSFLFDFIKLGNHHMIACSPALALTWKSCHRKEYPNLIRLFLIVISETLEPEALVYRGESRSLFQIASSVFP